MSGVVLHLFGRFRLLQMAPDSRKVMKIGIVCLLEPYFHTLLPSKLTLNYSKHVFSGVKSIWPL